MRSTHSRRRSSAVVGCDPRRTSFSGLASWDVKCVPSPRILCGGLRVCQCVLSLSRTSVLSPKACFQAVRFSVSGRKCPSSLERVEACRVCQPMHVLSFVGGRIELFLLFRWKFGMPGSTTQERTNAHSSGSGFPGGACRTVRQRRITLGDTALFVHGGKKRKNLVNFSCTSRQRGRRKAAIV